MELPKFEKTSAYLPVSAVEITSSEPNNNEPAFVLSTITIKVAYIGTLEVVNVQAVSAVKAIVCILPVFSYFAT